MTTTGSLHVEMILMNITLTYMTNIWKMSMDNKKFFGIEASDYQRLAIPPKRTSSKMASFVHFLGSSLLPFLPKMGVVDHDRPT